MSCKDSAGRARRRCIDWELRNRRACAQWRTDWTQRCNDWETRWEQRCTQWHTEQERRCDRWEEEQSRACADWSWWFAWLCILWTIVSTWVCRAWSYITKTVCDVWTWVSSTVCRAWVWIGTTICTLWTIITTFVCRTWVLVIDLWCSIVCALRRFLAPTEFSESRSECIYGWTSAYRAEFDPRECVLRITLRIRLVPQTGVSAADIATVQARWEPAIEQAWTGQFPLVLADGSCSCKRITVTCDVQFVASGEHHAVDVRAGSGRADMTHWFVNSTGGTAAHEAGHMFGNVDEYVDSNCPNRTITNDNSLMRSSQTGVVRPRHYESFARWVSNRTCCTYEARG